jgi:hypothetical protein
LLYFLPWEETCEEDDADEGPTTTNDETEGGGVSMSSAAHDFCSSVSSNQEAR